MSPSLVRNLIGLVQSHTFTHYLSRQYPRICACGSQMVSSFQVFQLKVCACLAYFILFCLIFLIIFGREYNPWTSSLCNSTVTLRCTDWAIPGLVERGWQCTQKLTNQNGRHIIYRLGGKAASCGGNNWNNPARRRVDPLPAERSLRAETF